MKICGQKVQRKSKHIVRSVCFPVGMAVGIIQQYRGADKSLARPDWKQKLKGLHFSSDAGVITAAETWLDGQPSEFFFFWVACKSNSLVAVACFLPFRAKDLSASR